MPAIKQNLLSMIAGNRRTGPIVTTAPSVAELELIRAQADAGELSVLASQAQALEFRLRRGITFGLTSPAADIAGSTAPPASHALPLAHEDDTANAGTAAAGHPGPANPAAIAQGGGDVVAPGGELPAHGLSLLISKERESYIRWTRRDLHDILLKLHRSILASSSDVAAASPPAAGGPSASATQHEQMALAVEALTRITLWLGERERAVSASPAAGLTPPAEPMAEAPTELLSAAATETFRNALQEACERSTALRDSIEEALANISTSATEPACRRSLRTLVDRAAALAALLCSSLPEEGVRPDDPTHPRGPWYTPA